MELDESNIELYNKLISQNNIKKLSTKNIVIICIICAIIITAIILIIYYSTKCPTYLYNTEAKMCCSSLNSTGYYNVKSQECDTCNNGELYDTTSQSCEPITTTDCSGMTYNSYTKSCCPTGSYYIGGTLCTTCPPATKIPNARGTTFDAELRKCIPNCNHGYTYEDANGVNMCIPSNCPMYLYNDFSNMCCSSNDGTGYYTIDTGCTTCPSGYSYSSNYTTNNAPCAPTCATGYTWNGSICAMDCADGAYLYDSSNNSCCPYANGEGYYNTVDASCEVCTDNTYSNSIGVIYDVSAKICTPICSPNYQLEITSDTANGNISSSCVISCEYEYLINYTTNSCCNSNQYYLDASCQTCPTDEVYSTDYVKCIPICTGNTVYNGTNCVTAECSGGPMAWDYVKQQCCIGTNPFYSELSNNCYNCPANTTYSNLDNSCNPIITCPLGYTYSQSTLACEISCSSYLFSGTECCEPYGNSGYYDVTAGICTTCPVNKPIYYPWGPESTPGTIPFYYSGQSGICGDCSTNEFMDYGESPPKCGSIYEFCGVSGDTVEFYEDYSTYYCCSPYGCTGV